jgi:integrase
VKRRVRGKRTTKRLDHLRIGFRRQQLSADGYVFPGKLSGKPLEIKRVGNWFRAVLKAAGLGRFKMYDLRHSYASQLLMQRVKAVDVAEVMGHKNVLTTLTYYAHWIPRDMGYIADKLTRARQES